MKTIIAFRFICQEQTSQASREMDGLLFLPPGCEVQLFEFETLPVVHTVFNAPDHRMEVTLGDWEEHDEQMYGQMSQRLVDHGWAIGPA